MSRNGLSSRPVVLAVDNDDYTLETTSRRLSIAGFKVLTVTEVRQALERVRNGPVHLVISEAHLKDREGIPFLREVRSIHPELPFLFLTAKGSIPEAVCAIKEGALDYLTTPVEEEELVRRIREILGPSHFLSGQKQDPLKRLVWGGKSRSMREVD